MTRALRKDVVATSRFLHDRGWVANHDGNVTVRLLEDARGARSGNTILATPTATSKRLVDDAGLIECDLGGKLIGGAGKPFGELGLHLAVYARRPDVGAVVHAHPPHATAIACSAQHPIERPFIVEALVSLGPLIPKVAFAAPGDAAVQALAPWCELVDAVLLTGHGAIAWGKDCEQALLRLELVEHLARIALAALPLGGVQPLPDAVLAPMMAARAKAGIGRAADRAVETFAKLAGVATPVVACAPAPHSPVPTIAPGGGKQDLAALIREEIVRALK